jgi:hypothetical protein
MKAKFAFIILLFFVTSNSLYAQYIPEIAPVDVYLNLEDIGFETEKDLGSEWGNFWTSENSVGGVDYTVEVESDDVNKVRSIRSTAINANRNESQTKQFLKYVGSVLFLNGNGNKSDLDRWIENNYNSGGTTTIRGISVEIKAPSSMVRIMNIKAN